MTAEPSGTRHAWLKAEDRKTESRFWREVLGASIQLLSFVGGCARVLGWWFAYSCIGDSICPRRPASSGHVRLVDASDFAWLLVGLAGCMFGALLGWLLSDQIEHLRRLGIALVAVCAIATAVVAVGS